MAEINFRAARNEDLDILVDLVNRAYRPGAGPRGWTHESDLLEGDRISRRQLEALTAERHSVVLIGLYEKEIVGCVHVQQQGNGNSYIGMLTVKPERQKLGLGKKMLEAAEAHAWSHFAADRLIMSVLSGRDELMAFYLRRGYRRTGEIEPFPLSAGAGTPKVSGLRLETLEKPMA